MKNKIFILALAMAALAACTKKTETIHTPWAYDATIYELNTRQFTPEGTFAAAEAQLPTLKALGVDIIWVMPIQPIGVKTRKGTLGSYYSIKDYCDFNPEFGTREDFVSFLNKAHQLDMYVILDWVANHTAPDSKWTQNPGWHYRDSLGNLMVQYDWTDISKLNYDNQDMRAEMKRSMRWWLDSIGIDGFRCDVAMEVPTDFWEDAFGELRKDYPGLFTLAEAEQPDHTVSAFDMYYGWELHNLMNAVAQQKKTVNDLWDYFQKADTAFMPYAIRMNFTSNHDENSWNGTEFERMGKASDAMAAFTYIVPGMPLIYTGQEYANDHRLQFFEKDSIARRHVHQFAMYQDLNRTRKQNPALFSPEMGAPMTRIECDNNCIFACARSLGDNTVLGIFNFSPEQQTFTLNTADYAGDYTCICGMPVTIGEQDEITLRPWEWLIYSKK